MEFGGHMMRTLASSVHGVVDEMKQIHTDSWSPVEKKGPWGHSLKGRAPQPLPGQAFIGFLIAYIKKGSFIMLRFALGNYFLQITKERMLLITSYRLTKKKCCKCKGMIRVIGLVTLQSLGELAQTSGSYFKDMHAVSIWCFTSGWGSFSKSKPQSSLGTMQAWFPKGEPIHGFGVLHASRAYGLSNRAGLHLPFHSDRFPIGICLSLC